MAKRTNKKPKLVRSSSIEKTINEGQDYVTRADRRLRIRNRNNIRTQLNQELNKQRKITKKSKKSSKKTIAPKVATKPTKTKSKKQRKRTVPKKAHSIKAAAPSSPAPVPVFPPAASPGVVNTGAVRTASRNLSRSGSKNIGRTGSQNNIIIEQQLQDRLGRHNANIGKLNFSLRWWDPNDLDLHVICPCGTQIFYANRKCPKCNGQLDIDMNNAIHPSLQPVQHVYFNKPKPGLYKFFVRYYTGPKQYQGVKGQQKSRYALSLHEDVNQIFRYQDTVSLTQRQIHYDFNR